MDELLAKKSIFGTDYKTMVESLTKKNRTGVFIFILFLFLGFIFIMFLFICLFAGSRKTAVLSEIIFLSIACISCFRLAYKGYLPWYKWGISLSAPMLVFGSLFSLSLIGGRNVNQDIVILISSGTIVLIGGLLAGYLGKLKRQKKIGD